jgi:predicted cupin superfamily sugar epimerase
MAQIVAALIAAFDMTPIPVEGALFAQTYVSAVRTPHGDPAGTAIVALYAREPRSFSCFHRLTFDEVWHFYGGDPFRLILLFPDGSSRDVVMGPDVLAGQCVQYTVPAHVWQAGDLLDGSTYALFGCTMAPGFVPACFAAGDAATLLAGWPSRAADIARYAAPEDGTIS